MTHGDKDLAIANYKKSLALNPKNTGLPGRRDIKWRQKEAAVGSKLYEGYRELTSWLPILSSHYSGRWD